MQPYQAVPLYNHLYAALVTTLRDPATFSTFIAEEYLRNAATSKKRGYLFSQHY